MKYGIGAGLGLMCPASRIYAAPEDYTGRFLVTLQAEGAWDVSSFCDPKENQAGEREITRWSRTGVIQTAGNLRYAPYGNNAALFANYRNDMLVINGIDMQTNSHTTGVLHNWSGRNSAGYPSLTALFSAINAPELPISYLNYGGYSETARMVRYTRLDNINQLRRILRPNTLPWSDTETYQGVSRLSRIVEAQQSRLARQMSASGVLPRQSYAMQSYYDARENSQSLEDFAAQLPEEADLQPRTQITDGAFSSLLQQMQVTTLAFKSGVAASADLTLFGFDTHTDHDAQHEPLLAHLADAIDYFWTNAQAEGIADRITLVIGSDFSRTPFYNSTEGKDHWPIGSAIIMEQGAAWGNRTVGATDEGQNALSINPATLEVDSDAGTIIYPRHVHKALRTHLGMDSSVLPTPYPFNNTEDIDFFNPAFRTSV